MPVSAELPSQKKENPNRCGSGFREAISLSSYKGIIAKAACEFYVTEGDSPI